MLIKGTLKKSIEESYENETVKVRYFLETEIDSQVVQIDSTLSKHLIQKYPEIDSREFIFRGLPYTVPKGSGDDYESILHFDLFKITDETVASKFFVLDVYVTGVYTKSERNKQSFLIAEIIDNRDFIKNNINKRRKIKLLFDENELSNVAKTKGHNTFICTLSSGNCVYVVNKDKESYR
jgi:hypothetical protein